jgi:hypothetical protein
MRAIVKGKLHSVVERTTKNGKKYRDVYVLTEFPGLAPELNAVRVWNGNALPKIGEPIELVPEMSVFGKRVTCDIF